MSQFSSDLRLVIFIFGIFWGIRTLIKEYRINLIRVNQKYFPLFALAVFWVEVLVVWAIIWLCSDWLYDVKNICSYVIFCLALACFCYSGYMFSGIASNDEESKKEKFRGKVAIAIGLYWLLATIVSYEM